MLKINAQILTSILLYDIKCDYWDMYYLMAVIQMYQGNLKQIQSYRLKSLKDS